MCCPSCRLVQDEAESCRACGQDRPLRIVDAPDRFVDALELEEAHVIHPDRGRVLKSAYSEHQADYEAISFLVLIVVIPLVVILALIFSGAVRGFVQAHPVVFGLLLAALLAGGFLYFVHSFETISRLNPFRILIRLRLDRSRRAVLFPVRFEIGEIIQRGHSHRGLALRWRGEVPGWLSGTTYLACSLIIAERVTGRIFLRAVRSAAFNLQREEGDVVVQGDLWVESAAPTRSRDLRQIEGLLELLAPGVPVPDDVEALEHGLRGGDRVEVAGEPRHTLIAERSRGYRDGGLTPLIEGAPEQVLLLRVTPAAMVQGSHEQGPQG